MRAWLVLPLVFVAFAGCFGGGDDGREGGARASSLSVPDGCGQPIFPGVRGREVDIAVDPNDRSRVAATAMLTPPAYTDLPAGLDLAVWQSLARSSDGGLTWDWAYLPGHPGTPEWLLPPYTGTIGLGDGIISFAPDGDLYMSAIVLNGGLQYNMLSYRFAGDSLAPAGPPTVFSRGAYDPALNMVPGFNPIAYNDKNDQVVDAESGAWYVSWMWRSNIRGMTTVPVVSMSMDGGASWQGPVMMFDSLLAGVTADDANVAPAPLILGDRVYVLWAKSSTNEVWAASAPRDTLDFGEPYAIASLGSGGSASGSVLTLPLINVATGPGGVGERAWLTARVGGDAYDIGVWYSDDGVEWMQTNTPHADTTNAQVIPTVAVAPDGTVAVQFLDFSEDPEDVSFHTIMSVSDDAGATWHEYTMTSEPTNTLQAGDAVQGHVGDYFGNGFTGAGLLGAWQDGRMGTADETFSEIYGCVLTPA
jgi:hypothetical protein